MLYELGRTASIETADLKSALAIDAGQLSRLVKRLEDAGPRDAGCPPPPTRAASSVELTEPRATRRSSTLDERLGRTRSARSWTRSPTRRRRSTRCASCKRRDRAAADRSVIRGLEPGDLGWLVERHGVLYAREYGWDETSSGSSRRIAADFDPTRDRAWIAEVDGERAGRGPVRPRHARDREAAHAARRAAAPAASASARRLVDEVSGTPGAAATRTLTLWTNDILHAARRIYERAGFTLTARGAAPRVRPRPDRADLVPYPPSHGPRRTEGAAGAAEERYKDDPTRR